MARMNCVEVLVQLRFSRYNYRKREAGPIIIEMTPEKVIELRTKLYELGVK